MSEIITIRVEETPNGGRYYRVYQSRWLRICIWLRRLLGRES